MDANIGDPRFQLSVEKAFEVQPQPGFWGQVTLRAMLVSALLGAIFCFMILRIQMTVGIVPSFNMPTTILSFFVLKCLISLMKSCGMATAPFTRQENMFVVTSVNNCINIALSGGFATCVIGMSTSVAETLVHHPNKTDIVDNLDTGKYMLFLLAIGLAGVLCIVPFTQIMLLEYGLIFPTGTVAAELVNSFHTPEGSYVAKLQVAYLFKALLGSFFWSVFQWFYSAGSNCGFQAFPIFGLKLYERKFYFDFSTSYVGLGMICPHRVNLALLFGGIISGGFLYPYIESKHGEWYHENSPTSLNGSYGYKVFLAMTIILTDGIFNFVVLMTTVSIDFYRKTNIEDSGMNHYIKKDPSLTYDERKRIQQLLSKRIPHPLAIAGYILCAIISIVVIPSTFHEIKFYHVAAQYMVAPVFAFCNTYGEGLTDWSVAVTYARITIFVMAAWIGQPGAIVASLVSCVIIAVIVQVSANVMVDLKSGYRTLTSPRVMVTGSMFGIILGSVINPCIFYALKESIKDKIQMGEVQSKYPCPAAAIYRAIGIVGMGGVKELPKHCSEFCMVAFFITVAVDLLALVSQKKDWSVHKYLPSMMVLSFPILYGAYFTISMCLGSLLIYVWTKMNRQSAELLSSVVAAGLIGGEGLCALPITALSLKKVEPPICMKFLPSGDQLKEVDSFLNSLASANS